MRVWNEYPKGNVYRIEKSFTLHQLIGWPVGQSAWSVDRLVCRMKVIDLFIPTSQIKSHNHYLIDNGMQKVKKTTSFRTKASFGEVVVFFYGALVIIMELSCHFSSRVLQIMTSAFDVFCLFFVWKVKSGESLSFAVADCPNNIRMKLKKNLNRNIHTHTHGVRWQRNLCHYRWRESDVTWRTKFSN